MLRTVKLLSPPSIHNIIQQDHNKKLNNQIKQFFKSQSYPSFPLKDLLSLPNYKHDQRYYLLVNQLQKWNKKVENHTLTQQSRAQLYRNKFLFTSLKSITLNGSKGSYNYQTNMDKLFQWFRKNSKQQMPMYFTARKKTKQDEDWQVRKTFKTNMPLQLKNYQRRALFTTQQQLSYLHSSKNKQPSQQKLLDYLAIKQYNSKQLKRRQAREQEEIEYSKNLFKSKKSKFQQNHCHNYQLYKGNFNSASKTTVFFNRKAVSSKQNKLKNSFSFSILKKQKQQIAKIKKYRFNSALAQKGSLFQQRDPNTNKTSKTFVTTKPFDATLSDFGQNIMTTRKQTLNKQTSINTGQYMQQNGLNTKENNIQVIEENKQNKNQEFVQFMQIKNWDGLGLMSNPFEKRKTLKKKKKK